MEQGDHKGMLCDPIVCSKRQPHKEHVLMLAGYY
jgi:hypothetical protein